MLNLYDVNGLMFWDEKEILIREQLKDYFKLEVHRILAEQNAAWRIFQIEAPQMTPIHLLNPAYDLTDVFLTDSFHSKTGVESGIMLMPHGPKLMLRPETTAGSYAYAAHLLQTHSGVNPPFIVWQVGKSFRREQDQATKNMRLKEFYQQEFQCIYSADTKNDYLANTIGKIRDTIKDAVGKSCFITESDRLPSYSLKTMDIMCEINNGDQNAREMELCSISERTDFPIQYNGKDLKVLEISIGLDRCMHVKTIE